MPVKLKLSNRRYGGKGGLRNISVESTVFGVSGYEQMPVVMGPIIKYQNDQEMCYINL